MQRFPFQLIISFFVFFTIMSVHLYGKSMSLSELELSKIVEIQDSFFKNGNHLPEEELIRQAQYVVNQYESYLTENPNDVNGLILFGKFLKRTGEF